MIRVNGEWAIIMRRNPDGTLTVRFEEDRTNTLYTVKG
jgi:hypothetical protein